MDITEISKLMKNKEISPTELVKEKLKTIDEKDRDINAFITVAEEEAFETAEKLEEELEKGQVRGPLHGIPVAVKDLIFTKGIRTTSGSKIYKDFIPSYDATVIQKLKDAGAIIIGKLNTHEFAYGPIGDRSYFGPCRNPHNLDKIAGGSSSGSAAAVAANMVCASLGTDTGGSIRIPASACGVVGMKPTFGLVSKAGVFDLAYTLDHIGPVTKSVRDNALLLNIIAGYDPKDEHSIKQDDKKDYTNRLEESIKGKTIGVATNPYFTEVDAEVKEAINHAINTFKNLQTNVKEVEVPRIEEIADAQVVTIKAEASAVHAEGLEGNYRGNIDDEVYERLIDSQEVTGYEYVQSQMKRTEFISDLNQIFHDIDVLIVPTLPVLPTDIGQREVAINDKTVSVRYALLKLTSPFNYTGNPALTIPCGFSKSGLPIGVQLIGRHGDEEKLYQFGAQLEKSLPHE